MAIQLKRDSAADWTSNNPTLESGRVGIETDTKRFKIGDGSTAWTSLEYENSGEHGAEDTVASATTTAIGATVSENVSITGTTTITGFGTVAAGTKRWGRFTGVLTLTHNGTSLILPGAANITTAAGDRFVAVSLGSGNWVVHSYTKASGEAVVGTSGSSALSTDYLFHDDHDEATAAGSWAGVTSGTGAAVSQGTGEASEPGLITLSTGTTTTGYYFLRRGGATGYLFSGGVFTFTQRVKIPTLSDGTETFTVYSGFSDGAGDGTDGIFFRYTHGTVSGNWQGVCRNNNSESGSTLNTAVPVVAATWYKLTFVVNAAGTSVEFFIDGVSVGTITTNIPVTTGRETGMQFGIIKSAGTTARTMSSGYVRAHCSLTR